MTGLLQEKPDHIINTVLYRGEYYCIDDPVLLEGKERVRIRVITEVSSEEDLYREYVRNNLRNPINPYALFILFMEKSILASVLPEEIKKIFTRNSDLDVTIVRKLNEQLLHFTKHRITAVDITVLNTIKTLLEIAKKEGITEEKALEIILGFIETWILSTKGEYAAYPDSKVLHAGVVALFMEKRKEKRRSSSKEEEEGEEVKKEEKSGLIDVNVIVTDQKIEDKVITVAATSAARGAERGTAAMLVTGNGREMNTNTDPSNTTSNISSFLPDDNRSREVGEEAMTGKEQKEQKEENEEKEEERTVIIKRTISFNLIYPEDRSSYVDELVNNILKHIERIFSKHGITVQTS